MNIYVGNLSYEVTDQDLKAAFESYGAVESASVLQDKYTGRSRGFGFVQMLSETEGQNAIDGLNGTELKGRAMKVNKARPRPNSGGRRPDRGRY